MQIAIGLTFPNVLQDDAILCHVCKNFDVEMRIIEASFSSFAGWAILKIEGTEEEIKKIFDFLGSKGIAIQQIETRK